MQFHDDPTFREEVIRNYLRRTLDADAAEAFESHYLSCDECFEELLENKHGGQLPNALAGS